MSIPFSTLMCVRVHGQRDTLMHLLKRSVPLLLHPGVCVRRGVEELLFSAARQLGVPDACVIMGPIVRPVLRRPLRVLERPLAAGGATASSEGVVGPTEFARRLRGVTLAPVSRRVLAAEIQKLDRRGSGEPASRGGVGATPADYSSSDSEDEDGDERQCVCVWGAPLCVAFPCSPSRKCGAAACTNVCANVCGCGCGCGCGFGCAGSGLASEMRGIPPPGEPPSPLNRQAPHCPPRRQLGPVGCPTSWRCCGPSFTPLLAAAARSSVLGSCGGGDRSRSRTWRAP